MYDEVYAVLDPLGAVEHTFKEALSQVYRAMKALPDLKTAVGDSDPEFNRSIQFMRFEDQLVEAISTTAKAQDQAAAVCQQIWNSVQRGA